MNNKFLQNYCADTNASGNANNYLLFQIRHRNMCEVIFNILKESLQNNSILDQLDYCINPQISDNSITINIESYTITLSFIPLLQLQDLHQNPCKESIYLIFFLFLSYR